MKLLVHGVFILYMLFAGARVQAQSFNLQLELKFVQNLVSVGKLSEALLAAQNLKKQTVALNEIDTLLLLEGKILQFQAKFDSSIKILNQIRLSSASFTTAKIYNAWNYGNLINYDHATQELLSLSKMPNTYDDLITLNLASYFLLKRNFYQYDSLACFMKSNKSKITQHEILLKKCKNEILKEKNKSPAVAGILSAFVPGLGKYYAGYHKQCFSTFIPVFLNGLITYESYKKMGGVVHKTDLKTIPFFVFGTAFSVFYLGNIIGSIKSVNTFKQRNKKRINNEILSNLQHINAVILE